jgi:hypothetical protein
MKQIEISATAWEQLHQLRYTLERGKILPSRAAVVDELLQKCKQAGRTMIDPDDYEIVRSARPIKCYICREAPAAYRETFAARDRDGRCHVRGLCEQCYQALQPEEP